MTSVQGLFLYMFCFALYFLTTLSHVSPWMGDRLGIHWCCRHFFLLTTDWDKYYKFPRRVNPASCFYVGWKEGREGRRGESVPISPDRWPAVVGSEEDVISACLTFQWSKTQSHQVWGLRQVELRPEGLKPELRRSSLISSEVVFWKCIPDCSLQWLGFRESEDLS